MAEMNQELHRPGEPQQNAFIEGLRLKLSEGEGLG
jgi:hypothetical protein